MVLIDTGPIVAAAVTSEVDHHSCVELFTRLHLAQRRLILPTTVERMADLVDQYADSGLDTTDASVIAIAERLEISEVATLNRRDFAYVRPRHVDAFTLLPERMASL